MSAAGLTSGKSMCASALEYLCSGVGVCVWRIECGIGALVEDVIPNKALIVLL